MLVFSLAIMKSYSHVSDFILLLCLNEVFTVLGMRVWFLLCKLMNFPPPLSYFLCLLCQTYMWSTWLIWNDFSCISSIKKSIMTFLNFLLCLTQSLHVSRRYVCKTTLLKTLIWMTFFPSIIARRLLLCYLNLKIVSLFCFLPRLLSEATFGGFFIGWLLSSIIVSWGSILTFMLIIDEFVD